MTTIYGYLRNHQVIGKHFHHYLPTQVFTFTVGEDRELPICCDASVKSGISYLLKPADQLSVLSPSLIICRF